jgi:D-inositol-3-phosphate glycosyltransferase
MSISAPAAAPRSILFCLDFYYPHLDGAEVLFQSLAEGLATRSYRVFVITQAVANAPLQEMHNGVSIIRIRTGGCRYLFPLLCLPALLRLAKQAELIHTSTFAAAPAAWLAARLRSLPVILTVHELWIGKWQRVSDASRLSNWFNDKIERALYRCRYDHVVAVSAATARDLREYGLPPARIHSIHNGIDEDFWDPTRYRPDPALRKQLGLDRRFLFFFSGRPGRSKGLPTLLRALAKLRAEGQDARLLAIVSNAPACRQGYREMLALRDELKLQDAMLLLTPRPYAELPNYLMLADTVVVPSLSEGFGFAAAEACALQRPVIVTDNASLPEVASGKVICVPPGDVDALAHAMGQAMAGNFHAVPVRRFPRQTMIDAHESLYQAALAQASDQSKPSQQQQSDTGTCCAKDKEGKS